jgi:hypothetical protein
MNMNNTKKSNYYSIPPSFGPVLNYYQRSTFMNKTHVFNYKPYLVIKR